MQALIARIPLLRIFIPLILGIIIASSKVNILFFLSILTFGFFIYIIFLRFKNVYQSQWTYNIPSLSIFLIIISLGGIITKYNEPNIIDPQLHPCRAFLLIDNIKEKESSIFITGNIIGAIDKEKNILDIDNKVLLNINGLNYNLKEGDIISFTPRFSSIKNMGNPDEFDYRGYQEQKGIIYTQHLSYDEYKKVGHTVTITTFSRNCQRWIINYILSTSISPKAQNFLITVILGDKNYLDFDLRNSFSNIGLAHILALSGLHISIILLFIYFLFLPLDMIGLRKIRLILTILCAFIYTILTGCSPSVVRALIMTSFILISFIFYRKNNSINSLFGAGIIILFFSPFSLYDLGFQFSFISVLSILILMPLFQVSTLNNKFILYPYNLFLITLSVIIGTGAISLYYFHTLSLSVFISNFLILPIIPLLLISGILTICIPFQPIIYFFENLYDITIHIVDYINNNLSFSINYIYLHKYDLAFYYISLISIIFYWKLKNKKILIYTIISGLIWMLYVVYPNKLESKERLIIYNDFVETPIIYAAKGKAYIYNLPKEKEIYFKNNNSTYFARNNISNISYISSFDSSELYIQNNFIYANNKRILLLDSKLPSKGTKIMNDKLNLDYIILTKNYYGSIKKILKYYNPKKIIISGNIFYQRQQELIAECRKLGIDYHRISEEGAYYI